MTTFNFFIRGTPAPGGSKNAFVPRRKDGSLIYRPGSNSPVVNISDAGKGNKAWRKVVAIAARAYLQAGFQPVENRAIECTFDFYLTRPKNHYRSGKFAHELHRDSPWRHIVKPDALKLARSTEDALTGIVWRDDSQVVRQTATKHYAPLGEPSGCRVQITLL